MATVGSHVSTQSVWGRRGAEIAELLMDTVSHVPLKRSQPQLQHHPSSVFCHLFPFLLFFHSIFAIIMSPLGRSAPDAQ